MRLVKEYILGWTIGTAAGIYGLLALAIGRTFLPGLHGDRMTMGGRTGRVLALAYLSGGLFLLLRHVLEKRLKGEKRQLAAYWAENLCLALFIFAVIYVLLTVDTVK